MTDILHQLLTAANQLAQLVPWDAVYYAPIVSPILMLIKKVKGIHNGEVMLWLTGAFSVLAGVAVYLQQTDPSNPLVVGGYGIITFIASQPIYKLVLKPGAGYIAAQLAAAKQLNEVKTAAVPAGGLPVVVSTPVSTPSNPVTIQNGQITQSADL